jgi:hypothetical protein
LSSSLHALLLLLLHIKLSNKQGFQLLHALLEAGQVAD